jgi:predicted esterase
MLVFRRAVLTVAVAVAVSTVMLRAEAAAPPPQAAKGPGGSDYVTADVVKQAFGTGSSQGLVFRPAGRANAPRPVVIFVHPPGAFSPKYYGAWIEHLARKGFIVVYPRYQEDIGKTPFEKMAEEAAQGIKAALAGLKADPDANPDLGKVVAVGHGGGALIALDIASRAARDELPPIKLVFGVTPTKAAGEKVRGVPLADLATLDPKTVLIMMTGDRDTVGGEQGARAILRAAANLPPEQRLLIRAGSDNHGQPPLYVGHYSPVSPNAAYDLAAIPGANVPAAPVADEAKAKPPQKVARKEAAELWRVGYEERKELPSFDSQSVDATDYLLFWRTFDIAAAAVLAGGDAVAIKRDGRLYDLGQWSDGWPLKRLTTESPKPEAHKTDVPTSEAPVPPPPAAKTKRDRT